MSDLVRLRVVTAFNRYRVGDVIERIPSVARQMLAHRWYGRKLVEEAAPVVVATEAAEPKPESLPAEAGTTRTERKSKKRGSNP